MFRFCTMMVVFLSGAFANATHVLGDKQEDPSTAITRERDGFHNKIFDDYYKLILGKLSRPHQNWLKSDFVFVGAQKIIVSRAKVPAPVSMTMLPSQFGFDLPVEMFEIYHDQIRDGLRARLNLTESMAELIANELERQAVTAARLDSAAYFARVSRRQPSRVTMVDVMNYIYAETYLKAKDPSGFDIPFVAGYALNNDINGAGFKIYIDRHIPVTKVLNGVNYPIAAQLTIHEAIEKSVLDEFETSYPHGHQNALRIEEAATVASGLSWKDYDKYMEGLIENIGNEEPMRVPLDLDLTPYYTYIDKGSKELVRKMIARQKNPLN